jgi:hypothetical protein
VGFTPRATALAANQRPIAAESHVPRGYAGQAASHASGLPSYLSRNQAIRRSRSIGSGLVLIASITASTAARSRARSSSASRAWRVWAHGLQRRWPSIISEQSPSTGALQSWQTPMAKVPHEHTGVVPGVPAW